MWKHYRQVLQEVVANPGVRIREIEMLGAGERRQLLEEWNRTEVEYRRELCVHELFEEQVERTPQSLALVYEDESLTFAELNERANRLAHYLSRQGVKPETLVGLSAERSTELIVGLLAILKAGGAYVPLDPTYPRERLSYMLENAEISVLLTQERLQGVLPEHQANVIYLDRDREAIACESAENLRSGVEAHNLAYVIYTSGSTGRPKGVQIAHGGVNNLSVALNGAIYSRYRRQLNVSLNAPLAFCATSQIVWYWKSCWRVKFSPRSFASASTRTLLMESPPRSKKLSLTPTRSIPNT
jgi:non-ribosomal peptide synthetase component F